MAKRALERLTRLLGVVTYLDEHGESTFDELAEHFGVSRQQISDDVNTLWVSGLPGRMHYDLLDFDYDAFERGVAHLTNSQGVRQVRLSPREAIALIGALSVLVSAGAAPAAAHSALEKLVAAVGDTDALTVVPTSSTDPGVIKELLTAVSLRRVTRVDYVDAHDRSSTRDIEPHRLVTIDGVAYVECFCRRAIDYRTLRIDRMTAATVLDDEVREPPSDAAGFALVPRYHAQVTAARATRWAFEDLPGVQVHDEGEHIVATFGVADADWVAARLMTVAPGLVTVEPAALREALAAHASAVASAQALD